MTGQDEQRESRHAWTLPGAETVAPGIHRIPLPLPLDGLRAVNVYAVEDGEGLVLIDGGWAIEEARGVLVRSLAEVGYELGDIRRVLVTHAHRDHYTQAIAIRRAVGAQVALGAEEEKSISCLVAGQLGTKSSQPDRLRALGASALADAILAAPVDLSETLEYYEYPDTWLEPGRIELNELVLDAVHTPGHTRGHLVFHLAEKSLLFAGDHLLPHITPSIGFEPDPSPFPLRDYLGSLERILAMPDAELMPAHGPVGGSTHERALALLAHHERRLSDTRAALAQGAGLALEVAQILRWTRHERRLGELEVFDQMLAVLETAAHLDVLVLLGDAVSGQQDGILTYALTG